MIAALSAGLELGEGRSRYRRENVLPFVNGLLGLADRIEQIKASRLHYLFQHDKT